jgi:hypothetical protein
VAALHPAHRQPRIVGQHRADAHHHGVGQRAQAVQVVDRRWPVDVVGAPRRGGDPPVERLTDLPEDESGVGAGQRRVEPPKCGGTRIEPGRHAGLGAGGERQEPRPERRQIRLFLHVTAPSSPVCQAEPLPGGGRFITQNCCSHARPLVYRRFRPRVDPGDVICDNPEGIPP